MESKFKCGMIAAVCGFILGAMAVCFGIFALGLLIAMAAGDVGEGRAAECPDRQEFRRVWDAGAGGPEAPRVARIRLTGEIDDADDTSLLAPIRGDTASEALARIEYATDDDFFDGLFVEIDSPGGGVTMSDRLAHALREFKESDSNRFVFVMMGDSCCSGGYYFAAPADFIMAHPTTVTGSIGVMIGGFNAAKLAEKIGVESVAIASGVNKDMLNPLKPVDPEHVKIMERPVNRLYDRFVKTVAEGRGLPEEEVRRLADGRVFVAEDALEAKLIDAVGYEDDAYDELCRLAGDDDVRIYRLDGGQKDLRGLLREIVAARTDPFAGVRSLVEGAAPRLQYRLH